MREFIFQSLVKQFLIVTVSLLFISDLYYNSYNNLNLMGNQKSHMQMRVGRDIMLP